MSENPTNRLDSELVARGMCPSRARAQHVIKAGVVMLNGVPVSKAAAPVRAEDEIVLTSDPLPYVSRAAVKLVAALDHFAPRIKGKTALDLGASTGGFVQVLLARGAGHVLAVDVGHGQLVPELRDDARVKSYEKVNARDLGGIELPPFQIITADLSFISLRLALPPALEAARAGCWLGALIKPQFEVGRANIGKGGIVKDASAQQAVCDDIAAFLSDRGWAVQGVIDSPIQGSDGNKEFLIGATKTR